MKESKSQKQVTLPEFQAPIPENDDWMYRPILKTNTRCNYDSDGIQQEAMDEFERIESSGGG